MGNSKTRTNVKPYSGSAADRATIISAIQTPLGLLALAVLLIEGILATITWQLTEPNNFYLAVAMACILFAIILVVGSAIRKDPSILVAKSTKESSSPSGKPAEAEAFEYEVFVAAPMAAIKDADQYHKMRGAILPILDALNRKIGVVFCALKEIETIDDFDRLPAVASDDFANIAKSRHFLMIYPDHIPTSTLVEAGFALAYGKPSMFCVPHANRLPFLLEAAVKDKNLNAQELRYATTGDIVKEIEKQGKKLFAQ
jgi:hypothetical protein